MGIENLLKTLKCFFDDVSLNQFKGKRMGIDGYCWLHQAIYCDDMDLSFNPESDSFVYFILNKLSVLIKCGITPVMVFDGNRLPIKHKEEVYREKHRTEKREKAYKLLEEGREEEARVKMTSSLDITPEMVHKIILQLRAREIEYVVAPYEADAQLAYLDSVGYIDVVCTEDSDLIAYGCRSVVYKLNTQTYMCQHITNESIFKSIGSEFDFFTANMFLQFCILSGCDFFKMFGISTKKAYKVIKENGSFVNGIPALEKLTKQHVSHETRVQFEKAYLTFKHQIVYCPVTEKQIHLTPLPQSFTFFTFFGYILLLILVKYMTVK